MPQYVMTLSGPRAKPPVQFLGITDWFSWPPSPALTAVVGIGLGLFLGFRKKRR